MEHDLDTYDNIEEESNQDDGEDMAELEAMLYSQIHYQPEDLDKSDFIVNSSAMGVTELPERLGFETPGGDSGCGLSHVSSDVEEEEEDVSKYSISTSKTSELVENPYFESESDGSSDSDSDIGIIVEPKPGAKPTEIIEIDSSSNHSSSIHISDSEDEEVKVVEELRTISRKNDKKTIEDSFNASDRKKFKSNKLEFGPDFSDNFLSSNDSEDEGSSNHDQADSDLTLNLTASQDRRRSRNLFELVGLKSDSAKWKLSPERPSTWTRKMAKFYNEVDETYLDIDLKEVLAKLPSDKKYWKIDRADVYNSPGGRRRQSRYWIGRKCNNCGQTGHLQAQCPEPLKLVRCHMCGQTGHRETRCPGRSCLWCGQPGFDFLQSCFHCRKLRNSECRLCGFTGHLARECPDTWRRYHATTREGDIVNPGFVEKPDMDCWCCNCGSKGHLVTDCHNYRASQYPNTSLRVISYEPEFTPLQSQPQPEGTEKKKKKEKKSKSCPSTPMAMEETGRQSEPASPEHRVGAFPSTVLVEKAIQKLDKRKKTKDRKEAKVKKEKLNHEIIRLMNYGKSKKQILAEILSNPGVSGDDEDLSFLSKKKHLKSKQIKTAISTCMSHKRAETRQKEWQVDRGFVKSKTGDKSFPRNIESQGQGSRANLVPTDSKAAVKFLKKEVQRHSSSTSGQVRRLSRELNQEIFGLKNLHTAGLLKKVERKRLADIVLQLREANGL